MYHNVLQSLADKFAPVKRITMRRQRLAPWTDDDCRVLRRHSRRLERRYLKPKKPCDRLAWIQAEKQTPGISPVRELLLEVSTR